MKLISRLDEHEIQCQRLREIIEAASNGLIAVDGRIEIGTKLEELVSQADIIYVMMIDMIDKLEESKEFLYQEIQRLSSHIEHLEEILSLYDGDFVEYDDHLDHATIDMMEALVASGASEPTFDGELSFQENIVISKEDFKPIVREAISSWLRLKAQQ